MALQIYLQALWRTWHKTSPQQIQECGGVLSLSLIHIYTTTEGSKFYLYSITAVAILGGLLFGYDTAVVSGAEKGLEAFFPVSYTHLVS